MYNNNALQLLMPAQDDRTARTVRRRKGVYSMRKV